MISNAVRTLSVTALVIVCTLAPPARADDYTDIWWAGQAEAGWGVNLVQSQDFIFATFFVQGPAPATAPVWYTGNLTRSGNVFTGPLYQTTGTGIGAPWNPAQLVQVQVGTATFTPTSTTTGTLNYNVNTTQVTKTIRRQTLTAIALGGSYLGTAVVYTTGCGDSSSNKTQVFDVDPVVTQNTGGQLQIDMTFNSESCTLSGTSLQEGQLFSIPSARYVCTNGNATTLETTARAYEIKATSIGLEGRWNAPSVGGGCQEDGSFAAVFP